MPEDVLTACRSLRQQCRVCSPEAPQGSIWTTTWPTPRTEARHAAHRVRPGASRGCHGNPLDCPWTVALSFQNAAKELAAAPT